MRWLPGHFTGPKTAIIEITRSCRFIGFGRKYLCWGKFKALCLGLKYESLGVKTRSRLCTGVHKCLSNSTNGIKHGFHFPALIHSIPAKKDWFTQCWNLLRMEKWKECFTWVDSMGTWLVSEKFKHLSVENVEGKIQATYSQRIIKVAMLEWKMFGIFWAPLTSELCAWLSRYELSPGILKKFSSQ